MQTSRKEIERLRKEIVREHREAIEKYVLWELNYRNTEQEHYNKYGHYHLTGLTGNMDEIIAECEENNGRVSDR